MFTPGKFGRGGGRGQSGRMVPPPRGAGAGAIAPIRSSRAGGTGMAMGRGVGPPRLGGKGTSTLPPPLQQCVTEETSRLMPGSAPPPFAMLIRLVPGLVEEVKRAEAEGRKVQIKFGPTANNPSGNIIDVGGKEFRFTWAREQGELCDIYEEQQSGEDGNGVLVESGSVWRKLNVQRTLSESERGHLKMRSEAAARQQKSRKAIILDHGNPVVKNQTKPVATASNDVNMRKLPAKMKKEPPPKKRKIEASSAAVSSKIANSKSATSPVAFPSEQQITIAPPPTGQTSGTQLSKGHAITDEAVTSHPKPDVGKQKERTSTSALTPVSEGRVQKASVGSTPTDLRSLLITQLTENPKGMTIKAIEKAIGVGKKIEPVIKTIANYQAPGRYILKPGVEKEGSAKLSPCSGSSLERQPSVSPLVDMSPLSDKAGEPTDEQQIHSTPKQDSDLNIVDEIDDHLHESPDVIANHKKAINSDGSGSSSSSDSGSDSESDSGSSDSGSDSDRSQSRSRSRSRSKSKSRSPAGSGSGSSSDSETEGSSSSSEESDVDIMCDDDKSDNEAETMKDLSDSKLTPSHTDRDEFGENYKQKVMIEQKNSGQPPQSPRNSEDIDVCDDIVEGEEISKIAQHYIGKITSDGEDDTDMAVDIDLIHCEGEIKSPEGKITISPEHRKREDIHSSIGVRGSKGAPMEESNSSKENPIGKTLQKSEKMPRKISKHGRDSNQSQLGSEKYSSRQDNRIRAEKKDELDSDMRRNRDVSLSQSLFESPARPEITSNRRDLETRQVAKVMNKTRFTNANSERAFEHATPVGRSAHDEDTFRGQASTRAQTAFAKDLDDAESFDQHLDGQQSYQRPFDSNSRTKVPDVMQGSGRFVDSLNKVGKLNDRASRPANESDISTAKSSSMEDKNSRYEMTLKTALDDDVVAKEKFNNSNFSKESENAERYKPIDSQCKRPVDLSGRKDAGSLGLSVMRNASKDTKNVEIEKRQLHSVKESTLKREYSDLELGEFREPVSEEEPPEPKSRFEKSQTNRGSMDAKVKSGAKREGESPDVAKGRAIGKAVPELKKMSPSEPVEEFSKHDGRIGKRMLEDGMSDLVKPFKKAAFTQARQPLHSDHTDVEPLSRQEMTEMPVKVTTTEMTKTSPFRGPETQGSSGYRKTPTSGLQKPEYKGKVQDATTCDNKDVVQKTKGNMNPVEKRKENTKGENNSIPSKKKPAPADEGQAFYAKYEKDKAELRGPIKNIEQFKEYVREFQEKYTCYQLLNTALESDKEDFQKLGIDLHSAKDKGDAQLFATISEQVKKAYSHCALRHKRMKKVFIVLHEELKNLKQRARDFDARYHNQIQGHV